MERQEVELKIFDDLNDGVFAISLVEAPAIEKDFIALSTENIELKVVDEERRVVVGFALIPEKRILRIVNGQEVDVFFTAETVRKTSELYMKNLNLSNVTTEHEKPIKGATVIESWIVEDVKNDKSNVFQLGAVGGEWVIMMKIYNDEEWEQVKKGTYKGFSIEGKYKGLEALAMSEEESILEQLKQIVNGTKKNS
jgi:hypothetical protein